jgi:hypothetical protein
MKNQSENELLSAYLDGELTPAEKERAERLLADSPAARRTLGELRALAATLQSLPRQKLGVDLSEQVLQAATQRKDAGDPSQRSVPRSGSRPLPPKIPGRFAGNPRLIIWPAIILTVAVLLMVFNSDQRGSRPVARGPDDKTQSGAPPVIIKGTPGETKEHRIPAPLLGVVVLKCQVSREVIAKQEYRKILDANNLVLPNRSAAETLGVTPAELADAAETDVALVAENPAAADASAKGLALVVDATPAQFKSIFSSLQSQPETYHEVGFTTLQSQPPQPSISAPSTKRLLLIFRAANSN